MTDRATQSRLRRFLKPLPGIRGRLVMPVACGVLLATTAAAEEKSTECDNSRGQEGLTACAWTNAEKADADMAVAFAKAKKAMEAIDKDVSEARPNPAGGVEALETSQRG